jgi:hypothetical protein
MACCVSASGIMAAIVLADDPGGDPAVNLM